MKRLKISEVSCNTQGLGTMTYHKKNKIMNEQILFDEKIDECSRTTVQNHLCIRDYGSRKELVHVGLGNKKLKKVTKPHRNFRKKRGSYEQNSRRPPNRPCESKHTAYTYCRD
jgi:hypothetical protein